MIAIYHDFGRNLLFHLKSVYILRPVNLNMFLCEVSCPAPLLTNSKSQETAAPESDGGRSDSRTQGGSDGGYLVT